MTLRITWLAGAAAIAVAAAGGTAQAAAASSLPAPHALHTDPAAARPQAAALLYSQDSKLDPQHGIDSQDFGTGDTFNDQGADDFTVPTGKTWTVAQVKMTQGPASGIPASENVFFYKNTMNTKKQDVPGKLVKKQTLKGKINATSGAVVISGITGIKLTAGHYWVSVQANLAQSSGEWFWSTRTVKSGSPAVWQNPGNALSTGCTTWANLQACAGAGAAGPDFMFALYSTG